MDRRKAIQTAILGIGASTSAAKLFQTLTQSPILHNQLYTSGAEPDWSEIKSQFVFEDGIKYFNHASLGTSPKSVIDDTETFRRTLEAYPSKYMWGGWDEQKEEVRRIAAKLLNAASDEIALIHNTTEGMNLVAASLDLKKGDEVIVGNHEHRTATSPWLYHQESKGIRIVRPELPIMPTSHEDIFKVYQEAITKKTKVISMVHLTNTNGMILPVKKICDLARQNNILTVIDAAQSMGAIHCDMKNIGCDFFTASGHKWLYSPKGTGIFFARKDRQDLLKPFIANRAYKKDGLAKLEDYNTRNLPELLGLGSALEFHRTLGLEKIMQRSSELRNYFLEGIKSDDRVIVKTPLSENLSHQILTVEKSGHTVFDLKNKLIDDHKIDVRGMSSHDLNGVRISFAIYHDREDIDHLVESLKKA